MGIFSKIKDAVAGTEAGNSENARTARGVMPTVRLAASAANGSAAELFATGMPCRVVIQQFQPLHMTDAAGLPMYAFALTVVPEGGTPYMTKVGNPVPTEALVHMFPGAQLPARVMAHDPQGVVIDWAAASAPVPVG